MAGTVVKSVQKIQKYYAIATASLITMVISKPSLKGVVIQVFCTSDGLAKISTFAECSIDRAALIYQNLGDRKIFNFHCSDHGVVLSWINRSKIIICEENLRDSRSVFVVVEWTDWITLKSFLQVELEHPLHANLQRSC